MQELVDRLRDVREGASEPGTLLRDASIKWATDALHIYRDELLTRALAISAALAQFAAELENPK